jgi:hypothetical protein
MQIYANFKMLLQCLLTEGFLGWGVWADGWAEGWVDRWDGWMV